MPDLKPLGDVPKYQNWYRHLEENKIKINQIEPLYIHRADKDDSVLYTLLKLDADTPEGTKLNPICFLKGDAVSMLVVLIAQDTNEKYVLLVRKRRVCDGSTTYEHPAGMIDASDSSPIEVAAREIKEETKLPIEPSDLKPLLRNRCIQRRPPATKRCISSSLNEECL